HQEDPTVQRTSLINTVISMVTDKTTSTPHHQPHKLKFKCVRPLAGKTIQENLESFVGGRLRDVDYRLIQRME
ncbi:hypothetical protein Tco_0623586, partial [Tanacetum coccineum]